METLISQWTRCVGRISSTSRFAFWMGAEISFQAGFEIDFLMMALLSIQTSFWKPSLERIHTYIVPCIVISVLVYTIFYLGALISSILMIWDRFTVDQVVIDSIRRRDSKKRRKTIKGINQSYRRLTSGGSRGRSSRNQSSCHRTSWYRFETFFPRGKESYPSSGEDEVFHFTRDEKFWNKISRYCHKILPVWDKNLSPTELLLIHFL